jgi:hypothetical protein
MGTFFFLFFKPKDKIQQETTAACFDICSTAEWNEHVVCVMRASLLYNGLDMEMGAMSSSGTKRHRSALLAMLQ